MEVEGLYMHIIVFNQARGTSREKDRCHNIQSPDTQRPRTKHIYSYYVNELLTVLIAVYSVMNRIEHYVLCSRTADSQFLYTGVITYRVLILSVPEQSTSIHDHMLTNY